MCSGTPFTRECHVPPACVPDGSGKLNEEEFVTAFSLCDDEASRALYAELDADNDGNIELEEFKRGFGKMMGWQKHGRALVNCF